MISGELFLWITSILSLGAWIYLWCCRAGFWRADQRLDDPSDVANGSDTDLPTIAAIVPARDEADVIAESVGSLLAQDYRGRFSVILVDDNSSDGTAETAEQIAAELGMPHRLQVISGKPLEDGWTGKMWAVHQGLEAATET
ncbi:MAG TPA: glycosyl transferase family 2, partial [Rhodospirillaceae bacterium]|nr:glycosyl transferase family 2 [Rhodospirillaceae bacterium]